MKGPSGPSCLEFAAKTMVKVGSEKRIKEKKKKKRISLQTPPRPGVVPPFSVAKLEAIFPRNCQPSLCQGGEVGNFPS